MQYTDACYNDTTKPRVMGYETELYKVADILQELVDKETPKKLLQNYHGKYFCRNCLGLIWQNVNEINYCAYCGQVLDWD